MKSITDIFIKRPVLAICFNLLILVAGLKSIDSLTVRQYPRSDIAKVIIETVYVGANADLVRGFVTTPLERVIASADGIDYMESSSEQGRSVITAHLRLNFDINDALTQIQSKVAQVRNDLPPEAEAPEIKVESSDNRFASMYLSFYSNKLAQNQITDYLSRVVQPALSAIPGVQKADILGARTFAMRIWLKPDRMAALGVTPTMVREALTNNNVLSAIGSTEGTNITVNLVTNTDLKTQSEFEKLVIKEDNGTLIRLSDLATVQLGAESSDEEVKFGGETATFMGIWALPNANSLDVIDAVRKILPQIESRLPDSMKLGIPYDGTAYIRDALSEVTKTLLETIFIVVIVIFIFIGSFKAVLVPVVAIPLSLIGTAALMLSLGFTINLLTLLAIVLAVGLVVDDAIVMLENVERHIGEGMAPLEAALVGARELVGPTVAMTITLAAVYAPIGIQGGLSGALFREFAFTLAGAVTISGIVAITLSPMMSSRLIKSENSPSKFKLYVEEKFNIFRLKYISILRTVLLHRAVALTGASIVIFLVPFLYMFTTKELAPREDQGIVFGIIQNSPNATVEQTNHFTKAVQEKYKAFPEYRTSFQLTRPTGGFSGMLAVPWSQRSRSTQEVNDAAWGVMSVVPGIRVIMTTPPPLPGGSDFPIEFVISSTAEPREIVEFANQLVGAAFQSGKFMFADTDLKFDLPQSKIILDRDKIASMGLSLAQIGGDISVMTGGNYINRFNIAGRSYKVIAQAKRTSRLNPEDLRSIYVTGPNKKVVPLATFATIENTVEPRTLNRFQQLNSAKIQGAITPGSSIDEGLKVLEEKAKEILPSGYVLEYAGESRQLRKEGSALVATLLLSLIIIFLVLASQFESFRDPLIILLGSVPLALGGALVFVFFDATTMNIYSQVGLITLVGLIAKNGILIVEFANTLKEGGSSKYEAIIEACKTRLRPVMMTSVATVVGHFPLVIAAGPGAGARNSIGIVLVSGMIIGTFFTLFIVPAIYTFITKEH